MLKTHSHAFTSLISLILSEYSIFPKAALTNSLICCVAYYVESCYYVCILCRDFFNLFNKFAFIT